jgi:hypothetical protein
VATPSSQDRHFIEEAHLMLRFPRRLALSAGLVAILAVSATGVSAAPAQRVVGHVYVNNNSAVHNTVAGFDRWSDGNLTPIAGSPFETGGAGVGSPVGSAGALQMTANGKYLLAVDAASNDISVLRVHKDGSLTLTDTEPSNGTMPVSITVHKSLVYVANTGAGGSNYTGFRLRHGDLTPIAGSTFALPDHLPARGSSPGMTGRVQLKGAHPIDAYPFSYSGWYGRSCRFMYSCMSFGDQFKSGDTA